MNPPALEAVVYAVATKPAIIMESQPHIETKDPAS
jgi:hypothetical protein